jgi:cytochrome c553
MDGGLVLGEGGMKQPILIVAAMAMGMCLGGNAWAAWHAGGGEMVEAMALTPVPENGKEIYELCAECHMAEGWGLRDGTFPQLAGQHRKVLIKQLADIRDGNRDNPTMFPFALPESIGGAQSIADVVAYIQRLPMNPDNGKGEWQEASSEYAQGKRLYGENCVPCHKENGEGSDDEFYPRIQGQHYSYILRQLIWIRDGKRRNANPDMLKQLKGFTEKDLQLMSNYVSRIPVDKKDLAPSTAWKNPDFNLSR